MIALGSAGSAINIRENTLVVRAAEGKPDVDVNSFGHSSLGACELFRPMAVVFEALVAAELKSKLEAAGVAVLDSAR